MCSGASLVTFAQVNLTILMTKKLTKNLLDKGTRSAESVFGLSFNPARIGVGSWD